MNIIAFSSRSPRGEEDRLYTKPEDAREESKQTNLCAHSAGNKETYEEVEEHSPRMQHVYSCRHDRGRDAGWCKLVFGSRVHD